VPSIPLCLVYIGPFSSEFVPCPHASVCLCSSYLSHTGPPLFPDLGTYFTLLSHPLAPLSHSSPRLLLSSYAILGNPHRGSLPPICASYFSAPQGFDFPLLLGICRAGAQHRSVSFAPLPPHILTALLPLLPFDLLSILGSVSQLP
jgi:hypothetical protein